MQVITVTDEGTLRIEFTADEAKQIRQDIERGWPAASDAGRELTRYIDILYDERRLQHNGPTFPGGGF
jgi:hypothetical protein